jgi:hypothetical protein
MRVTELPHVVGASEGFDHRGQILRIVTDLPIRPKTPGHNTEKLQGLRKAIEQAPRTVHCSQMARTRPPGWS